MTIEERLEKHLGKTPDIAAAAFVAPCAEVHGDVTLGQDASVFYGAVLRGDINTIEVGEGSNIQDGAIIHLADDFGAEVGRYCTVGHGAIVHACRVGDECLIGMRATLLDGCVIGARSIVGAGAVVTPGTVVPPGSMVLGCPGKVVRALRPEEQEALRGWAEKYVAVARAHRAMCGRRRGA